MNNDQLQYESSENSRTGGGADDRVSNGVSDLEKNFIQLKNEISLTSEERAYMRTYLEALSNSTPVYAPIASPYPYFAFFTKPAPMLAFLLMIAVIGSTTAASAAETALPGDALYGMKIHINEKVESTFAFTPATKAETEIRHAELRLQEIQLLAASGKDERIADAALAAEGRIALARTHILTLIAQSPEASDAESELSYALSAHADILDAQAIERDDDAGISMSGLARVARGDDDTLLATAERAQKTVEKAQERIDGRKLSSEIRDALQGELALVMGELARSEVRGSVRGFALAERHAYRVLALADSAEKISSQTGKQIQISFSKETSREDDTEEESTRAKTTAPAATLMMTASSDASDDSKDEDRDEDRDEDEDDEDEKDTVRTLKLHIEDDEDRDEDSHSGKDDSKDEDEDEDDEDSSGSNSGSGSGH